MKTVDYAKLAVSALALGMGATIVSPVGSDLQAAPANPELAAQRHAAKASKLLASLKADKNKAVKYAEKAVALSPMNADYRYILARAYLASGRLTAAETTFNDVVALDPNNKAAALKLALMKAASGQNGTALRMIEELRDHVDPADYGLALALAGDVPAAINALEAAARSPAANARVRQNLALSYAFANRWGEARVVASQDLAAEMVNARLASWAQMARPNASWDQVAGVLGVRPVYDAGQPQQLALDAGSAQNQALAEASSPPPAPVKPMRAAEPDAQADTAPVFELPVAEAAPEPVMAKPILTIAEAPVIKASPEPVKQAVVPVVKPVGAKPVAKPVSARPALVPAVAVRGVESGRFVLQLGAFANAAKSELGWNRISAKVSDLREYSPVGARVKVNGTNFYRLSVSGFTSKVVAGQLCTKVKAAGGSCFIRSVAGDTPIQWARKSGGSLKIAARR